MIIHAIQINRKGLTYYLDFYTSHKSARESISNGIHKLKGSYSIVQLTPEQLTDINGYFIADYSQPNYKPVGHVFYTNSIDVVNEIEQRCIVLSDTPEAIQYEHFCYKPMDMAIANQRLSTLN